MSPLLRGIFALLFSITFPLAGFAPILPTWGQTVVSCAAPSFDTAPPSYSTGGTPLAVVVADFNGDGQPDLAVANSGSNSVGVLLGNADASFVQPAVNYPVGTNPYSIAVGDFNRDGHWDLAVSNYSSNSVSILLGNGDGTFQLAVNYGVNPGPWGVAVGDFNRDGNLDVVVGVIGAGGYPKFPGVEVLLGNGDGTLQAAVGYGPALAHVTSIAVADFNGDGKLDLVATTTPSSQFGSVRILLGDGDGTFGPVVTYPVGKSPVSVAVGDFNADGKPDLAVANVGGDTVSILLGQGDGTFHSAATNASRSEPSSVVVADFNGDGKPDLAVAHILSSNVSILTGNGDGTFQAAATYHIAYLTRGGSGRLQSRWQA